MLLTNPSAPVDDANARGDALRMRRLLIAIAGAYVLAALLTRLAEASGAWKRCGCEPNCWCKKPGLSLFRWVVPVSKHHLLSPADKQMLAEAQRS